MSVTTDGQPGCHLQLQPQARTDSCVVRFDTLAAAQEALQQLGGGMRGKFRCCPAQVACCMCAGGMR
jgi:hypothetical protein